MIVAILASMFGRYLRDRRQAIAFSFKFLKCESNWSSMIVAPCFDLTPQA
jgi:hypothetical protein